MNLNIKNVQKCEEKNIFSRSLSIVRLIDENRFVRFSASNSPRRSRELAENLLAPNARLADKREKINIPDELPSRIPIKSIDKLKSFILAARKIYIFRRNLALGHS